MQGPLGLGLSRLSRRSVSWPLPLLITAFLSYSLRPHGPDSHSWHPFSCYPSIHPFIFPTDITVLAQPNFEDHLSLASSRILFILSRMPSCGPIVCGFEGGVGWEWCGTSKDPWGGRIPKRCGQGWHLKVCFAQYRQVKSRNMLIDEETSRN